MPNWPRSYQLKCQDQNLHIFCDDIFHHGYSYEADYVIRGPGRIGSTYRKAVYRQYTDNTYTEKVDHPEHLGILGPVLMAEVGDRLVLHFKNTGSYPATMHPHGVFYNKNSEGEWSCDLQIDWYCSSVGIGNRYDIACRWQWVNYNSLLSLFYYSDLSINISDNFISSKHYR